MMKFDNLIEKDFKLLRFDGKSIREWNEELSIDFDCIITYTKFRTTNKFDNALEKILKKLNIILFFTTDKKISTKSNLLDA